MNCIHIKRKEPRYVHKDSISAEEFSELINALDLSTITSTDENKGHIVIIKNGKK